MTRAFLLPLTALLALATGVGLFGVAATLRSAPIAVAPATVPSGATSEATTTETARSAHDPLAADVPVELAGGPALLRVARLALAPGAVLPPVAAAGPTALVVEAGTVGVVVKDDGWVLTGSDRPWVRVGPDKTEFGAVLGREEHLTLRPGTVGTVRNTGSDPAVVLVVSVESLALLPRQDEPRRHP
jgi:hypothetical protein